MPIQYGMDMISMILEEGFPEELLRYRDQVILHLIEKFQQKHLQNPPNLHASKICGTTSVT